MLLSQIFEHFFKTKTFLITVKSNKSIQNAEIFTILIEIFGLNKCKISRNKNYYIIIIIMLNIFLRQYTTHYQLIYIKILSNFKKPNTFNQMKASHYKPKL